MLKAMGEDEEGREKIRRKEEDINEQMAREMERRMRSEEAKDEANKGGDKGGESPHHGGGMTAVGPTTQAVAGGRRRSTRWKSGVVVAVEVSSTINQKPITL